MNRHIKDRGTKKWSSIMLPEHVEAIKEVFEEEKRIEKPILDEQQRWENETKLQLALHNNLTVELKIYEDGSFLKLKGKIMFMDAINRAIHLESEGIDEIQFENITNVMIL